MSTKKELAVAAGVAEVLAHGDLLLGAVAKACEWRIAYERCNPDVGMGPTVRSQVVDMMEQLKVNKLFTVDEVINRLGSD